MGAEEEASIREMVAELGTTRAGKDGKPDRVSVSVKNPGVISERLGTGRSTGALQQHWCAAAAAAATRARACAAPAHGVAHAPHTPRASQGNHERQAEEERRDGRD